MRDARWGKWEEDERRNRLHCIVVVVTSIEVIIDHRAV